MRPQLVQSNNPIQLNKLASNLTSIFSSTEARMRVAHENHLGYPYNLNFDPGVPPSLEDYLINNLGDPYTGSHYASEICELER